MIIITKSFSEGQIDISHLSPGAQKRIIERERQKIELDQKIADTKSSLGELKQRAQMSIADNARIGEIKTGRNELVGAANSIGGMGLSTVAGETVSNLIDTHAPGMGSFGKSIIRGLSSSLSYRVVPEITKKIGQVGGAIRGLTAESSARRKERKLQRLIKKRDNLED